MDKPCDLAKALIVESGLWISEYLTGTDRIVHSIDRVLVDRQTPFQRLTIIQSAALGRALLLDGTLQSCTTDEFIYHESLVHPALFAHEQPRSVLVLGGAEGATAREALRHRSVERVSMIDIDRDVVDACAEHLVEMHRGAFDDDRLRVTIGDAIELLDTTDERWDVVISDVSDPIQDGPSAQLFTREYFAKARRVLAAGGRFVVQAGSVAPLDAPMHARLHHTVASVFAFVSSYVAFVPSFGTPWSFIVAADEPFESAREPECVDRRIAELRGELRSLCGASLRGQFALPVHLQRALADCKRPYTLAEPPRFGGG